MVQTMFERTNLPVEAILGAYAILEKGKLPCTARNLIAASFSAFKAYTTKANRRISFFQGQMVPALQKTDLAADELRVLAAASWGIPSATRVDCVRRVAHEAGAGDFCFDRAIILSLLLPECDDMPDTFYALVVLFAAVHLANADVPWLKNLPTVDISRDDIVEHGMKLALCGDDPTKARVPKRKY